jgi:hypothetical protein
MEATPAATMEAAAVEPTAMETATSIARTMVAAKPAMVIAGTPVDSATPAIPAIPTAVITAAVVAAAVIGSAVIPSRVERTAVTDPRVDAALITTGKRDRERRKDCAQKNPTANHGFSPWRT